MMEDLELAGEGSDTRQDIPNPPEARPRQPEDSTAPPNANNQEDNPLSSDLRPAKNDEEEASNPQHIGLEPDIQKRFTGFSKFVLIAGPIVSFGTLGFLAFLWAGSYRASNGLPIPQSWYNMLDSGWILQAVPLITVVFGTVTAMEAGIATSMLAALLIERPGVRLSRLADVSVLRSIDSPPHTLAWRARHDILAPPLHTLRYLLAVLLLTTLITQLSSNILLFDFAETVIPRVPTTAGSTIRFSYSATNGPTKYVNGNLASYFGYSAQFPRFAEYSEPPVQPGPGQERDFRDTGIVYRAFIPLPKESREQLRQYSGPATVLDARVVCARPTVSRFAVSSPQIPGNPQILFANLTFSLSTPAALKSIDIFTDTFVASARRSRNLSMPVATHSVPLSKDPGQDARQWAMSIASVVVSSRAFLLFNWTGSLSDWNEDDLALQDSWVRRSREEWAALSHRTRVLSVDITLCVTQFNSTLYLIDTGIGEPAVEPEVAWDNATGVLSTADAAKYLGPPAEGRNRSDALLLNMATPPTVEISKNYTGYKSIGIGASVTEQAVLAMENMLTRLKALDPTHRLLAGMVWAATLCYDTNLDSRIGLHNSFTAVFQDVVQRTRDPAVAVQSLLTMATANAYVELQPYFDFELPAAYSVWARAFIPTHWRGFILVTAAVVVHALAVMAVAALFVRDTRSTELGNSWQAVAQLMDADIHSLLPEAARFESGKFKKWIRREGRNVRYHIVNEDGSPQLARA